MPGELLVTAALHPFRVERHVVAVPEGLTITEIADVIQLDPILREQAVIFIAGEIVPRSMWARVRPRAGQHLEVRVLPAGGGGGDKDPLRMLLVVAVIALSFAAPGLLVGAGILTEAAIGATVIGSLTVGSLITAGVGLVGMLLVNALVPVRPPKLDGLSASGAIGQDSPTLFIQGARNQIRPFSPVPVPLGRHRMVPPLGARPYTETIGDKNFVRILFVWGIGPLDIDLTSLKIGETPLTEFEGVQTEHTYGYSTNEPVTLFPDTVVQEDFTVALTFAASWVTRTSQDDADELGVDIVFPQGLVQFDTSTGARGARSVTIQIEFREVGDTNWSTPTFTAKTVPDSWISGVNITFTHNKTAAIVHGFRWATPARGQYEIRIRRMAADVDSTSIFDDTSWTALRTFTNEDPINSPVPIAKTALVIQATDQLQRIVDEFNGVVTSKGYDWNGSTWVADQEINNPASVFRHALQGDGIAEALPDARIDLTTLADWHEFCTAKGFTFNMVRDFRSSVYDLLADVAAAGRASPTMIDGKWSVIVDDEQATRVSHVTPRNSSNLTYERLLPDLPHAWRVRFNNENEDYRQDEYVVYSDGYSESTATKFEQIEFPGVTNPDHVFRHARYRLAQGLLQPERWTFSQDVEYLTYRRGDRIGFTHDVLLLGLASGRVKSVEVDTNLNVTGLTVDEDLVMESGKTYGIVVRGVEDAELTSQVVLDVGTQRTITLTTPIPFVVTGEPAIAAGDLFGFGLLGSESDDVTVIAVRPESDLRATVTVVPYRPAIYAPDTEPLPTFETKLTPLASLPVIKVQNVVSDESSLAVGPGESLRVRVVIQFNPFSDDRFENPTIEVQQRATATGEPFYNSFVEEVSASRVIISGVRDNETYDFRLRFVVRDRILPAPWSYVSNHTVIGRSTPPAALTNATISVFGGQALIRWDPPEELDVQFGGQVLFRHSAEFVGATWSSSYSIGNAARSRDLIASLPLKPGTYLARVYDQFGTPSDDVVSLTTKQASVLAFADVDSLDEAPTFSGTHDGTVGVDSMLKLDGTGLFDDIPDLDDVETLDGFGGLEVSGTYDFAAGFDLVTVKRVRLTVRITMVSVNVNDLIDDRTELIDDWEDFDGTNQAETDVQVFVRHTDDDPAITAPDWSAWERLDSAEFEARGFEFQARLTSNDVAYNIHITELGVDVEEIV